MPCQRGGCGIMPAWGIRDETRMVAERRQKFRGIRRCDQSGQGFSQTQETFLTILRTYTISGKVRSVVQDTPS